MCRWLAYHGSSIFLQDLILEPEHSLIDQSIEAHSAESTTNGDGFGVGWFDCREEPGVFRSVRPAWNDRNLAELARQIRSPLFLAHVRSATGTAIQRSNCHPFRHGRWLFMHNGRIRGFRRLRRPLALEVAPELYVELEGTTDSELMFFLALTFGLDEEPREALERMAGCIESVGRSLGVEEPIQATLGLSDGERILAVRYSSRADSGTLFCSRRLRALREINQELEEVCDEARTVVSEPLTDLTDHWEEVPEGTSLVSTPEGFDSRPFRPRDPSG